MERLSVVGVLVVEECFRCCVHQSDRQIDRHLRTQMKREASICQSPVRTGVSHHRIERTAMRYLHKNEIAVKSHQASVNVRNCFKSFGIRGRVAGDSGILFR
jgi:hypothetical protein